MGVNDCQRDYNGLMKRMFLFPVLFCISIPFQLFARQSPDIDYREEMQWLYRNIQQQFHIPASGYYKEHATRKNDDRQVSYLWPVCALLQAANEMEQVDNSQVLFQPLLEIAMRYYDPKPPQPGYASYPPALGGGTRFYDDNQWIGLAALDAYQRKRDTQYLQVAETIYRFMMSGYDTLTGGGLYWEEGNLRTKNTCSNAPGIVLALQLYQNTGKKAYLDSAMLLYHWVNKHLLSKEGLYFDNISMETGKTDERLYAYNTGCMIQANVHLYEITRQAVFIRQAVLLADRSAAFFLKDGRFRDNYWFSAVLLRGYLQLLQHHPDTKFINAFKACTDKAIKENKHAGGLMGKQRPVNLVGQGGMLEILARLALQERSSGMVKQDPQSVFYDVVVYGGTSAGVTAAVQAAKMNRKVLLISASKHLGGLSSSGLGGADVNNHKALGGLSKYFFESVYNWYADSLAWKNISRNQYFKLGGLIWHGRNEPAKMQWMFEPAVAERIFRDMLAGTGVTIVYDERLQLMRGVTKKAKAIRSIRMESGKIFRGSVFIDATYEGDLMAHAGVSYIVGRESNSRYDESRNGILINDVVGKKGETVDPYRIPGKPGSGLLPFIEARPPGRNGEGDHRTQAYCYRFTLSSDPANSLPLSRPADYDSLLYEVLARRMQQDPNMPMSEILTLTPIPNRKTDTNHGDLPGGSYQWPEGDYKTRDELARLHKQYTMGLVWFCASDARVPAHIRKEMNRYGWPKDEFTDNDHFPYLLYVREARRMISDYVMTEHDYFGRRSITDPVGLATYRLDTHTVSYFVDEEGRLRSEGVPPKVPAHPYAVSYRAIRPKAAECTNLLVPGCLSSSHSAYSSIRMEPVFMIMGQSAGAAAAIAAEKKITVQAVPYEQLKAVLLAAGQLLNKEDLK